MLHVAIEDNVANYRANGVVDCCRCSGIDSPFIAVLAKLQSSGNTMKREANMVTATRGISEI